MAITPTISPAIASTRFTRTPSRVVQFGKAARRVDLTKGTEKLTQELVTQIIGCSYEVFTGAVYAGQEKMPDLPGMTDKTLKMLIEEASGATLLEAAYGEAQLRVRTRKAEVDAMASAVSREEHAVNVAFDQVNDAEAGKTAFEVSQLAAVKAIHTKAIAEKKELDSITAELATRPKLTDLRAKIAEIDKAISVVDDERRREGALMNDAAAAARDVAIAKSAVLASQDALKRTKYKIEELDHKIGCPCPSCDRPLAADDIAPAKKIASDEAEAVKRELSERMKALSTCENRAKIAADALEKHRASMTDVSAANAARVKIDAQIREVVSLTNQRDRLTVAVKGAIDQIKAKKAEVNPFIARIKAAETALAFAQEQLKKAKADLERVSKELKVAETVAKVFSPAGVRAFLLDEVTPFLNDQTAKYLGTLSDGNITATWTTLVKTAKGELREKFSIEVENVNGGDTFGLISGGEKRKVRIACALALQDLVARRATKPIELFIGDEIDDALDPAGIERLTAILEEKARERGSVFIISHSDLKDWVRNTITVTRKGKMATFAESVS
jgi:DNA repair exonuclease SbcCD ATPase subunit